MLNISLSANLAPIESSDEQTAIDCQYTFDAYYLAALNFAKETMEWIALDPLQHYTTDGESGWRETSDNAHGGLNIAWAFHRSANMIEQEVEGHLLAETRLLATCLREDEGKAQE